MWGARVSPCAVPSFQHWRSPGEPICATEESCPWHQNGLCRHEDPFSYSRRPARGIPGRRLRGCGGSCLPAPPLASSAWALAETALLPRCSKGTEEGPCFHGNGNRPWLKHSHVCSQALSICLHRYLPSSWHICSCACSRAECWCRPASAMLSFASL